MVKFRFKQPIPKKHREEHYLSSMNINIGSSASLAGTSAQPQAGSTAANTQAAQPTSTQVSYQNLSNQSTMNLLTERMLSSANMLNAMDVKELNMLVRELLSMPREIQQLLALLAFGEGNAAQLANLFKDAKTQLLISQLQQLLGKNSKEVINKLIQLTQNNALFFEGSNQLRDIMGLIQKVATISQHSPADALTTAMIMYLPWLPLVEQQKLELTFGFQEDEENGEKIESEVLVLFIRTENIGTFKVTIILNNDKTLEINIESDSINPKVIQRIINRTNEQLEETGVSPTIASSTRKSRETRKPKEFKEEASKSLSLHPSGRISVITMNAGFTVAKVIFATDEKVGLLKNREEKIK